MSPERAKRILHALEWRQADLIRQLNRVARTRYRSSDAAKWFNGARRVPLTVVVFLKMALRRDREVRRLLRALYDRRAER
jgi:hypothetical protein